jgi:hypothetical protein
MTSITNKMGTRRGNRQQQQENYAELEEYMSDSDEEEQNQTTVEDNTPIEELRQGEINKAVLLENIPITTAEKVGQFYLLVNVWFQPLFGWLKQEKFEERF